MQELRAQAAAKSGVPYAAVTAARDARLYERLGAEKLAAITEEFYTRVYEDEGWFRAIFANTTKEAAMRNQREFLAQEFGGPALYRARKGHTALLGRHAPYEIGHRAAERWVLLMEGAVAAVGVDGECFGLLMGYFRHMAAFVVFGRELVNPGRTVGYYGKHAEGEV